MRKLTYFTETESELADYVFEFVFETLGLPFERISLRPGSRRVDLYYGNSPGHIDHQILIPSQPEDRLWRELLTGNAHQDAEGKALPFDLISAIGAFLTDAVNADAGPDAYDKHGRLKHSHSYQSEHGIASVPVVNLYVNWLGSVIKDRTGAIGFPLWPGGKNAAIGLSHDVDIPQKYAFISNFRMPKANRARYLLKLGGLCARFVADRNRDDYWLFPQIAEEENRRGVASTMFFAATNAFSDWGSYHDVAYSVSTDRFRSLFSELAQNGFDIGLHAGYNSYACLDRLEWEKNCLARMAGYEITGLRHHCWQLGGDVERTLSIHSQAGFHYDSSIAFNDQVGFRRNVALPFYPWISRSQRRSSCVELPVFCMDANLFHSRSTAEEAVRRVDEYVSAVKTYSGIGVIDWHIRTSHPDSVRYREWGAAYMRILEMITSDGNVWVANLRQIANWLEKRAKRLQGK